MPLPTNRAPNGVIQASDINAIAADVNAALPTATAAATFESVFAISPLGGVLDDTAALNARIVAAIAGAVGGAIAMQNRSTAPAATPAGGGVLYVEAGALKFKGSSGTVTTVAPA